MSDPILLIHGAWQGAWAWDRLVPYLTAAGHKVLAADLPGNGVDGTAPEDATLEGSLNYLEALTEGHARISVIGHSGGGLIAGEFAERCDRVVRLAYVAGMMLPAGMAFAEVQAMMGAENSAAHGVTPHLAWSEDGQVSSVPEGAAMAHFFSDCLDETARAAAARLRPQGRGQRGFRPASADRVGALPRLYIAATEDRSVPIALQRHMQSLLPGALTVELPTGHVPHLSVPGQVAEVLLPFLSGAQDAAAISATRVAAG